MARLLVIDDWTLTAAAAELAAGEAGAGCDHALDGVSGVERARAGSYDLVLASMHGPGLNGLEVARALAGTGARVVLIGEGGGPTRRRCAAAGVWALLPRPVSVADVRRCLDDARRAPASLPRRVA